MSDRLPDGIPGVPQLEWRPLSIELADAWFPLSTAVNDADGRAGALTVDDLRDELASDWLDLAQDTRIGFDSDGVARAFGLIELRPGDVTLLRAYCWGGVHPDWRGHGIGRALLDWQHRRGIQLVAARRSELGPDTPAILRAEVPSLPGLGSPASSASSAGAMFTHIGMTPARVSLTMRRDLTHPVEWRQRTDGLSLVPYRPSMDDALRQAHNTFFADHWGFQPWSEATWRHWATGHRAFRPDWSFVVLDGPDIVGYVICAAYTGDWAVSGFTQGYITKVGTAAAWRRQGVARALLNRAMAAFAADGMQYAGLDVDADNPTGALALYLSLGFEEWRRAVLWELPL